MTHPHPRALEAAAIAVAEETDRDSDDYYALKLARAAVTAYLAEAGDGWADFRLPCAVKLENGTTFGKGVALSTLILGLQRRARFEAEDAAPPAAEEKK